MTEKCHFIGIGGIGMSGLARILLSKKVQVTGSDLSLSYLTEDLIKAGAKVFTGHSSENVSSDMTVIYTSGIKKDNPEYQAALHLKCPLLHRSDLLLELMSGYKTLAVAGTHGKTTTTALLTAVLHEANYDPAFAVGGILPQFRSNGGFGKGEYFVAEADESDGTFLKYSPYGAICTNIDRDHMDYYHSDAALSQAFKTFFNKVSSKKHFFWCGDNEWLTQINPMGNSYGFNPSCLWKITHFHQSKWKITYNLSFEDKIYKDIEVNLTGKHNALNSAAVFGMALSLNIPEEIVRKAFLSFPGVMRRCEKKGEAGGVSFIDDYAHHPTEIVTTINALREAFEDRRLIVVFQPHRYTRTQDCLGSYGKIFNEADTVIITDIYGAGEAPIPGISSQLILEEIKSSSCTPAFLIGRSDLVSYLGSCLRPHDVLVSLGAGDITRLSSEVIPYLNKHPIQKYRVGVVFGGKSVEHEVSIMSAKHVSASLNRDFYEVHHFGISKQGQWSYNPGELDSITSLKHNLNSKETMNAGVLEKLNACDVIFPVLHGPNGEDGTIQGFFEILDKPYVGCNYQAAAVCMDKSLTKKLMLLNGIATSPFYDFSLREWKKKKEAILSQIHLQLRYPLFVKPVHLGSTVGVTKVESEKDLESAIDKAFSLDHHIIVENGLIAREIEFAVFGNGWVKSFPPGEILTEGKVYHYADKYGPKAIRANPLANLPEQLVEEGIYLAETAYKAAGCSGMARVDFFLDQEEKYWLNEINPIPGFTPNSLYPKICERHGLKGDELVDQLIILGFQRHRHQNLISSLK